VVSELFSSCFSLGVLRYFTQTSFPRPQNAGTPSNSIRHTCDLGAHPFKYYQGPSNVSRRRSASFCASLLSMCASRADVRKNRSSQGQAGSQARILSFPPSWSSTFLSPYTAAHPRRRFVLDISYSARISIFLLRKVQQQLETKIYAFHLQRDRIRLLWRVAFKTNCFPTFSAAAPKTSRMDKAIFVREIYLGSQTVQWLLKCQ
jgi:hypothetical protein